jgi:hypothetical protein
MEKGRYMSEKISVEEARKLALSGGWGSSKKKKQGDGQKYNNNAIERDGIKFDSELEYFAHSLLSNNKIPFDYQFKYQLIPPHTNWAGDTVKRMNMFIDFRIHLPDGTFIYFDTKGFETEESKMKYKMLSYQLVEKGEKHRIIWKHTKEQVLSFILRLKNE